MPLALQSLTGINQSDYTTAQQLILKLLQAAYPTIDLTGSAEQQLLVNPAAALQAANQTNINRAIQAGSFAALAADPTLIDTADENVVTNLCANYQIAPIAAAPATGTVTIVLSSLLPIVIPQTAVFTDAVGNEFSPTIAYSAKINAADVVASGDVLETAVGDGTYAFTISVQAVVDGAAGNITLATALTIDTADTPSNFVRAFAAVDFSGGTDAESLSSLVNRARSSWTCRAPATRFGLEGLFRAQSGYAQIVGVSTVGFGDAEQLRNHSLLPLTMPGRVDSYVKVTPNWESVQTTVTATFVGTSGGHGLWQFSMPRSLAPIYKIDSIKLPKNADNPNYGSYAITANVAGYDISTGPAGSGAGLIFLPDIQSATEAAFSRYQTATVTFLDTDTSTSGLVLNVSTQSYVVAYRGMSGIATLQDAAATRSTRSLVGDVLVKAAVPCFCTVTVNVNQNIGSATINTAAVQSAVAAAINATGFIGQLPFSLISAAAQAALPVGCLVTSVTAAGNIYRPDGTIVAVSGSSALVPTSDTAHYVSQRTICFFSQGSDVTLNVTQVASPES